MDETLTLEHIQHMREAMKKQYHVHKPVLVLTRGELRTAAEFFGVSEEEVKKGNVHVLEKLI